MSRTPPEGAPNIFYGLRYDDAPAAIDWLERAFGFRRSVVVPGENGTILHAELRLGPGTIMLGSSRDDEFRYRTPRQLGGVSTSGVYIYVPDVDAHYAQAKAAGAEIVWDLKDTDYGSREYSARDPEGHLWSFGNYHPDAAQGDGGSGS